MNFLEKDLETIIWENYAECEKRGLFLGYENGFEHGLRFRQMNLMPFGIADLVNVYFNPYSLKCFVQIIECKKQRVDSSTYLQAKRYGTAIEDVFFSLFINDYEQAITPVISYILIGAEVYTEGELAHVIAKDDTCQTFIYKYKVDGIHFEDYSRHWAYGISSVGSERQVAPRPDIKEHIAKGRAKRLEMNREKGNFESPLLVTPQGVLLNTWLTDFDTYGPGN